MHSEILSAPSDSSADAAKSGVIASVCSSSSATMPIMSATAVALPTLQSSSLSSLALSSSLSVPVELNSAEQRTVRGADCSDADGARRSPSTLEGGLAQRRILSVAEARRRLPLSVGAIRTVETARAGLRGILRGADSRTVVIAGPCSIHSPEEALAYARKLRALAEDVKDRVLILMRVYFEKPRTHVGWKGLVSDPHLNGSRALEDGLLVARQLLCEIAEMGLPAATEFLDPLIAGYLGDAVSWAAIGARTTESQTHRQLASGLGMPVGFKNGTDGGLDVAINAIKAAREPHGFLGVDGDGHVGIVETTGNPDTHVVLRGAGTAEAWRANYAVKDVAALKKRLGAAGLPSRVLVDCSHANCGYDFRRQGAVVNEWIVQREDADQLAREGGGARAGAVFGLMLESNLNEGRQAFGVRESLREGVSVTDGCIGWAETEELVRRIHAAST